MGIKVTLLSTPLFESEDSRIIERRRGASLTATSTEQNQEFKNAEIQNGYGTATKVSVSPGFGATVSADIRIEVDTVSEETFDEIIDEVKKSESYRRNAQFKKEVDQYNYSSSASSSSGIFGWLVGKSNQRYSNSNSNITTTINEFESGDSSNDITVANSVANIMVKNTSKVLVTAKVNVTGQLLVPSPTVIAVESTVFNFTQEDGTTSSVTMLNQTPLVPVDSSTGTVSNNTLEPGSSLVLTPIGG